jgi:serine/threonine protein kinase
MTKCGTPLWVAPEVLLGNRFSESCDVYSFAIILWELIAWQEPFPNLTSKAVMQQVATKELRPTIPRDCPESLREILSRSWKQRPEDRATFPEVVRMLERIQRFD